MPRLEDFIGARAPGGRRADPGDFGTGAGVAQMARAVGQLGDVFEQFAQVEISRRTDAEAAEVRAELSTLLSDPLLTPEQFEEQSKAIVDQRESGLLFPSSKADFKAKVGGLVERGRAQVRGAELKRFADQATAHLDRQQQILADQFGQARDPEVKKEILDEFTHALNTAQSQRVIGAVDRFNRERAFTKEAQGGDIREAIRISREGPPEGSADAVIGLLNGTLGRGLSEADRQSYITTAMKSYEGDLRRRNAENSRIDLAKIREDKAINAAAKSELDLLLDQQDRGPQQGRAAMATTFNKRLEELFTVLTTDERKFYRKRQREGGGLVGGVSNPLTYNELDDLATAGAVQTEAGVFVRDAIEKAYRRDDLNRPDRDRLLAKSVDARFQEAEAFLKRSLNAEGAALGNKRFIAQNKNAQAFRAFADFKIRNPNASRKEAFDAVEELVIAGSTLNLRDLETANLKPTYRVLEPHSKDRMDSVNTRIATSDAFNRGDLSTSEYEEQIRRIIRIEKAQEQSGK